MAKKQHNKQKNNTIKNITITGSKCITIPGASPLGALLAGGTTWMPRSFLVGLFIVVVVVVMLWPGLMGGEAVVCLVRLWRG